MEVCDSESKFGKFFTENRARHKKLRKKSTSFIEDPREAYRMALSEMPREHLDQEALWMYDQLHGIPNKPTVDVYEALDEMQEDMYAARVSKALKKPVRRVMEVRFPEPRTENMPFSWEDFPLPPKATNGILYRMENVSDSESD